MFPFLWTGILQRILFNFGDLSFEFFVVVVDFFFRLEFFWIGSELKSFAFGIDFFLLLEIYLAGFSEIPEDSGGFWRILEDSGGFWRILRNSGGFWRILEDSGGFLGIFFRMF